MRSLAELKSFTREAARILAREKDLASYEIYCATAEHRIARLAYTSDIPSRGLEEFKSLHADGFQLRIAMRRDPHEVGAASEAGDFTSDSVRDAIRRARSAAVVDPHFPGFPAVPLDRKPAPSEKSDLARVGDGAIAAAAWDVLDGALAAFAKRPADPRTEHPGLIIGGDVSVIRDRIAIFNSNFSEVRADEGAHFNASVTSIIESLDAKGTATALGDSAAAMRRDARVIGRDAVRRALALSARRPARAGKISGGAGTAADRRDSQLHGDGLAHHRRVSRRQFRVSREIRRARDGFTLEPRRQSDVQCGRVSASNHLRRNPHAPCRIDPRRQAGRLALEFLRYPSHAHRRASR